MADAQQQKADVIITQGATQSNHARQTVAIAAKLGMACEILLEDRTGSKDPDYNYNGNVFLDQLHGANLTRYDGGTDMNQAMQDKAAELKSAGKRAYIVPGGGSNPIGALGYVNCALELNHQANSQGLKIDHLVHATGSAGTQAGLVCGMVGSRTEIPVLGIGVRVDQPTQEGNVLKLAKSTADHIGIGDVIGAEHVHANCDYVGDGYGVPTDGMIEALTLLARHEAILLDPVYSGKGMAGLIDLIRRGKFKKGENVVFLHTGGSVALFGYPAAFNFADYRA